MICANCSHAAHADVRCVHRTERLTRDRDNTTPIVVECGCDDYKELKPARAARAAQPEVKEEKKEEKAEPPPTQTPVTRGRRMGV